MPARATSPMPISPRRKPGSTAATCALRARLPLAPRPVSRSDRLDGPRRTTSPATSRRISGVDCERITTMRFSLAPIAAVFMAAAVALPASSPVRAQAVSAEQRGEIEKIVREYLLSHPELLQEAMAELEKREAAANTEKLAAAVKQNEETIFSSPRQVNLGNVKGDIALVEFFDYNCAYCKRAMADMLDLLKND